MARALTSDELNLLRSDKQWSKLYLAVLNPNTIYTALLNGVPTSNDQVSQITFDNASGTLGDVKPGMTLYVGTSAGAFDLGMCRIRKDPIAGTFYIGLTSEINWQADCYLTVVDDFDLWAKHALIVDSALVMDVDVEYDDQHTDFNPVPVLGPHAVLWLDDATVDVDFVASDSWVFDSTISAYAWTAPGSSASSGMATATPTITYNAAGIYRVFCTVTAANGKTTVGVRYVFVYDRDANPPATVFQLAQATADYETGGWMFDLTMEAEASLSEIRDRALVVLFAEDWYGPSAKQSIGPVENRENIVCVGRIVGESIRWDRESGMVHFTVQGPHYWLNKIKAFPVELTFATDTPDSWSVLPSMTVDRVLWHILYWHSTAIETMDFFPTNDDKFLPDGKSLASTIWGQLLDVAQSRLLASPGVDRFGRLIIEIDPQMVPEADRDWPTVMELTDDDWQEGIDLARVTVEDVSLITLSSQQVDESGNVTTLYSLSPGHVPRRFGEPMPIDRILASSQSDSNSLAGLALGWHTNEFPDVPVILAQNNRMIDLWPRQFCALTVAEGDTPRGIAFDGNLIPRRIALTFNGEDGSMHPELNFEAETFEQINTDGDIPDVEDLSIPPLPGFPTLPILPPIFPGDTSSTPDGPKVVILVDDTKGILYSKNFHETTPQWVFWNAGIPSGKVTAIGDLRITPNGSVWISMLEPNFGGRWYDALWYAPSIGAQFVEAVSKTYLESLFGSGGNGGQIHGWGINPNKPEEVAFIGHNATGNFMIGNHNGFTQKVSYNPAVESGQLTFGLGKWIFNENDSPLYMKIFSADGSSIESSTLISNVYHTRYAPGPANGGDGHIRAGTSGVLFFKGLGVNTLARFTNGDPTTKVEIDPTKDIISHLAVSHDGNYLMGGWDPTAGARGRSSDGGYTWSGIPTLPFGGDYAYAYAGGLTTASRWIAARGVVRYSPDFGETWQNKETNLMYLIPVGMSIIIVRVPGF